MSRLLLILALIGGLLPSLGEAVEMVVHYATTGHVAHSESGETDLADSSKEHGCGPTDHHCRCCASQQVLPPMGSRQATLARESDESMRGPEEKVAPGVHQRLLRPPIAA